MASTTTFDVSAPTRLAHNLAPPLTQPVVANETVRGPGKGIVTDNATDSIDIKDEYIETNCDLFECERLTHDFYVYEKYLKEIIVKDRLKKLIEFWESIHASSFIIDTIMNGYKIHFYSVPNSVMLKNNQSALKESHFVIQAIKDLVEKGFGEKCSHVPIVVNPLSISIQSSGKND